MPLAGTSSVWTSNHIFGLAKVILLGSCHVCVRYSLTQIRHLTLNRILGRKIRCIKSLSKKKKRTAIKAKQTHPLISIHSVRCSQKYSFAPLSKKKFEFQDLGYKKKCFFQRIFFQMFYFLLFFM